MKITGVDSTLVSINFSWICSIMVYAKIIPANMITPAVIIRIPFNLEPYRFDKTKETPKTIVAGAILSDMNWNIFGAASKPNSKFPDGLAIKLNTVIISATKKTDNANPAIARYFSNAMLNEDSYEVINYNEVYKIPTSEDNSFLHAVPSSSAIFSGDNSFKNMPNPRSSPDQGIVCG